jgi:hypothetical protein
MEDDFMRIDNSEPFIYEANNGKVQQRRMNCECGMQMFTEYKCKKCGKAKIKNY